MLRVVLDTDADNEIDDQYAISYLVKSERFDIQGIYVCPYFNEKVSSAEEGMEKSYNEIIKVLNLAKHPEYVSKVKKGSNRFLQDEATPVNSEAARDLIKQALRATSEKPLIVVAIGCLTNVASAILLEPSIKDLIHVYCLGGVALWLAGTQNEFNFFEDPIAARVVFKNVKNITVVPGPGVASALTTSEWELRHWLSNKNELCDYLVEHTCEVANGYAKGKPWTRIIWDISAVVAILNDFMMVNKRKEKRFIPLDGATYGPYNGADIDYVYQLHRDAIFEDVFFVLAK